MGDDTRSLSSAPSSGAGGGSVSDTFCCTGLLIDMGDRDALELAKGLSNELCIRNLGQIWTDLGPSNGCKILQALVLDKLCGHKCMSLLRS